MSEVQHAAGGRKKKLTLAVRLQFDEPRHECERCGLPEGADSVPWRREFEEDGKPKAEWRTDCAWEFVGEWAAAVGLHNDWKDGITPVAVGWCEWLPKGYRDVVGTIANEIDRQNELARQRAKARAEANRGRGR